MDYTIHGILQVRILEWMAFPFCRGSSQPRDRTQVSRPMGGLFTIWVTGKKCHWKIFKTRSDLVRCICWKFPLVAIWEMIWNACAYLFMLVCVCQDFIFPIWIPSISFSCFLNFFFNWRIVALQCCVSLCSESVVHTHIFPLFWIPFPFRSPQSTEQSSLCYTVGSC